MAAMLSVGGLAPASADPTSDLAAIQAVYDHQCALMMAADYDSYADTLTSDFQLTDINGQHFNRDQYMQYNKAGAQLLKLTSCTTIASNFVVHDDGSASVRAVTDLGAGTGAITRVYEATFDDVWVPQGTGWAMKTSKYLTMGPKN
jgi:hypothetical protein